MKYSLEAQKKFKKGFKKLSKSDKILAFEVIEQVLNGEHLESKCKNHKLKGKYSGCNECHMKPDLLLIYKKMRML